MDFSDNLTKVILAIIAIFAVGAFIAIKIIKTKNSNNRKTINQNRNNTGGGDIVGGDKTTLK